MGGLLKAKHWGKSYFVGRPYLYALSAKSDGVKEMIEIFRKEMDIAQLFVEKLILIILAKITF